MFQATAGLKLPIILTMTSKNIILLLYRLYNKKQIYFSIYDYATVTTTQGALIIGGYAGSSPGVTTVACYNNSGWSRLDDLQSIRWYHRSIINGDNVYVIGGDGS